MGLRDKSVVIGVGFVISGKLLCLYTAGSMFQLGLVGILKMGKKHSIGTTLLEN